MQILKQSTASQTVLIGPYIDDTDFKTAETGLTIANTDIRLSKAGGNMADKNSGGGTHDEAGWYVITLDATDTATVGILQLSSDVSGALAIWHEYYVLEEAIYDALFGASAAGFDSDQRVDVGQWIGNVVTVSGGNPDVNIESLDDNVLALTSFVDGPLFQQKGTAQAGANTTITLESGIAVATDSLYNDLLVSIIDGTGDGQTRRITGYVGSTLVATVNKAWVTNPDNTSVYILIANSNEVGIAGAGLTAMPWAAAWDAEVQSEVADALAAFWTTPATLVDLIFNEPTSGHTTVGTFGYLFQHAVTAKAQTGTLTTTIMTTDLGEATDDHYIGRIIVFITGVLAGQATDITDYSGTNGQITMSALTEAPSNNDQFVIF